MISVVIPFRDRIDLLQETIRSIVENGYQPLEVLLIDDSSSEESLARCYSLIAQYSGLVRVIASPHRGVSAARNAGIHAARGSYIAFCDSDDLWKPGKLTRQLKFLEENCYEIVASNFSYIDLKGYEVGESPQADKTELGIGDLRRANGVPGSASSVLARSELCKFPSPELFDKYLECCEDWDAWMSLIARSEGKKIGISSEFDVGIRRHELNSQNDVNRVITGHLRFIIKRWRQIDSLAVIYGVANYAFYKPKKVFGTRLFNIAGRTYKLLEFITSAPLTLRERALAIMFFPFVYSGCFYRIIKRIRHYLYGSIVRFIRVVQIHRLSKTVARALNDVTRHQSDPLVFTESVNGDLLLPVFLQSYLRHSDGKIVVFIGQYDCRPVNSPRVIYIEMPRYLARTYLTDGHVATAMIWAVVLKTYTGIIIHLDSDTVVRGDVRSALLAPLQAGYDVVGGVRNYRHNPHNIEFLDVPDTIATYAFGIKSEVVSDLDVIELYTMINGRPCIGCPKVILDFFDPVVFYALHFEKSVYYMDSDLLGGCNSDGTRFNGFGSANNLIDIGSLIIHYSAVGSGLSSLKAKELGLSRTVSKTYDSYALEKLELYLHINYGSPLSPNLQLKYRPALDVIS